MKCIYVRAPIRESGARAPAKSERIANKMFVEGTWGGMNLSLKNKVYNESELFHWQFAVMNNSEHPTHSCLDLLYTIDHPDKFSSPY